MEKDPFKEYLRESEPDKAHKGYVWSTAIGLQAVDGLKPSKYLIDTAIQNIEGKITMKEAQSLIDSYYEERPVHLSDDDRTEEADKVSSRIAEILSETAFSFSPNEYISIHRKLFRGIYFKVMANPYLRGRQYENNGSVLHQIFKDTWILCNQCYFCGKCVVFQKCTCPCKLYEPAWCGQILLSQYLGTEKENINSRNN